MVCVAVEMIDESGHPADRSVVRGLSITEVVVVVVVIRVGVIDVLFCGSRHFLSSTLVQRFTCGGGRASGCHARYIGISVY